MAVFGAAPSEVADAVMRGDKAAVRKLVEQHADVNAPQADGATALHWAVFRSDKEMVDLLLRAGANAKAANREGATPLWLASVNGDAAIIDGAAQSRSRCQRATPAGQDSAHGGVAHRQCRCDEGAARPRRGRECEGNPARNDAADVGRGRRPCAAIQLLIQRGADIKAHSNLAERGRGPALGKSNDPRKQVAAQGAALAAGQGAGLGRSSRSHRRRPAGAGTWRRRRAERRPGRARWRGGGGRRRSAERRSGGDDQPTTPRPWPVGFGAAQPAPKDGGALTPLVYAVRANDLDSVKVLLAAGADVNQVTGYGWSPLLVATQNRYYKLGAYLLEHGADVNLANKGAWTPLYLATDNRNIESGDYPVRKGDMDHLDFIKLLLDKGANVNARMKDSTETRTVFTNQWLDENGATAFLRASQSGDIVLMKLLLAHGADPKIETTLHVTALQVAAGIGWVEGITYEWSPESTLEAVKMLLDLGLDPNAQADTGRTALHGAAHKGRPDVVQVLVDHGAKLDVRDYGNTDNRGGKLAVHTWEPVDYADGLVRVGVQSAIAHPETGLLLRKLMTPAGLPAPPVGRTLESICITDACE